MAPIEPGLLASHGRVGWYIGDVLSVVLGCDVSLRGPAAAKALVGHILGATVYDAPPDAAARVARFWLVRLFPSMSHYSADDRPSRELLGAWLDRRASEFGEYLAVPPMPPIDAATWLDAVLKDPNALEDTEDDD